MNEDEFRKIYGYENRETHRCVLFLQSTEYLIEEFKSESKDWIELSDKLKDFFYEMIETDGGRRILVQIGSLERVDFDEIAKSFME